MTPAKLTVSGFEDLLTMPANVLFSGPQRFVVRKMQLLAISLPEQVIHHLATADTAGDADSQVFIQPECAHIKSIMVQ